MSTQQYLFPNPDEYAPYYQAYLDTLQRGDLLDILQAQMKEVVDLLRGLTDEQAGYRYAEGKWSIREVIGHIVDTERIFATRALCFARGESADLPGYDQDLYVSEGYFDARSRDSLAGEYRQLRTSNLFLFETWGEDVQRRRGRADGKEMSVRAIPWMIAGHERHHLNVITSRYLASMNT
ncbi:DinB family protein [bacterium]|nr:DinB family protein [bacterium]